MKLPIPDRKAAGRALAALLAEDYRGRDLIVLGLPRGGVPVAAEIARELEAPLDVLNIRKLGVPFNPELAMGAIASGGIRVLNPDVLRRAGIGHDALEEVVSMETRELERRERLYRGDRVRPALAHRIVVLVDDGVATGASMEAAVEAVRQLGPERVVTAVAVAPLEVVDRLEAVADEVVCLATPEPFYAVGSWYEDFSEVRDGEVRRLLRAEPVPA
ncbi:MAG: phosphoribosyltransferase family protein [Gammaproteobacteria bacterium]|jgi:putative phosphoribosyl transferase